MIYCSIFRQYTQDVLINKSADRDIGVSTGSNS